MMRRSALGLIASVAIRRCCCDMKRLWVSFYRLTYLSRAPRVLRPRAYHDVNRAGQRTAHRYRFDRGLNELHGLSHPIGTEHRHKTRHLEVDDSAARGFDPLPHPASRIRFFIVLNMIPGGLL